MRFNADAYEKLYPRQPKPVEDATVEDAMVVEEVEDEPAEDPVVVENIVDKEKDDGNTGLS